jgi:hypothetical protein
MNLILFFLYREWSFCPGSKKISHKGYDHNRHQGNQPYWVGLGRRKGSGNSQGKPISLINFGIHL